MGKYADEYIESLWDKAEQVYYGNVIPVWLERKNKNMAKDGITTLVFRGRLQYAKVLGEPVLNYNKDGQEWKFDFIPNDEKSAAADLKAVGVSDRLRSLTDSEGNPRYEGQKYMSFKQNATRRDGTPNYPIKVVDALGEPWPEDKLIGNDTVADVKFVVIDNGKGRFNGVYPRSIRILDLVEYNKSEFEPLDDEDEYLKKAQAEANKRKDMKAIAGRDITNDDLDDDFPDMDA